MCLASLQFSSLIVLVRPPPLSTGGTLIPAAASAVASLFLVCLSRIEHRRSVAPSDLSTTYLLATGLFNAVWLAAPSTEASEREFQLARLELLAKVAVFAAESWGKADILLDKYKGLPPELKTGALGKAVFWWINPVLAEGYNNLLLDRELPSIDHDISSSVLRNNILKAWTDGREFLRKTTPRLPVSL
jgi:ATP-binding cassette, subfamily C (CFTR/MRP), member 1